MPIYEFYCQPCHTLFKFFSRRIDTDTTPSCPKCNRSELRRQVSLFSVSNQRAAPDGDAFSNLDDARFTGVLGDLAQRFDAMSDNDPRQVAGMMQHLMDATGVAAGDGLDEAVRRMALGEDPDRIEDDLGDALDDEAPFREGANSVPRAKQQSTNYANPPYVDDTLYDL